MSPEQALGKPGLVDHRTRYDKAERLYRDVWLSWERDTRTPSIANTIWPASTKTRGRTSRPSCSSERSYHCAAKLPEHPHVAATQTALALTFLRRKKFADAESVLRPCLATANQNFPDYWITSYAESLLGGALLGQKKYAEAEPLLVHGYEGLKAREARIPAPERRSSPRPTGPPLRCLGQEGAGQPLASATVPPVRALPQLRDLLGTLP
jgi:hypothetical protein